MFFPRSARLLERKFLTLFTRSVKNFVRRAFFCFFDVRWKFLIVGTGNLVRSIWLKAYHEKIKKKRCWCMKFFTLCVNKTLSYRV